MNNLAHDCMTSVSSDVKRRGLDVTFLRKSPFIIFFREFGNRIFVFCSLEDRLERFRTIYGFCGTRDTGDSDVLAMGHRGYTLLEPTSTFCFYRRRSRTQMTRLFYLLAFCDNTGISILQTRAFVLFPD